MTGNPGTGSLFFADGGHEDRVPSNDHATLTVRVRPPTHPIPLRP